MSTIEKKLIVKAPIDQVWAALTDLNAIGEWMLDEGVRLDLRMNGEYRFFNGETSGKITLLAEPTTLEYTWRQNSWDAEWEDSLVHWELESGGRRTRIRLTHSQLPNKEEHASHDEAWDMYWLEPMIDWLEENS
jgi:uncharacterized protein YndB with AHSA1/START domain